MIHCSSMEEFSSPPRRGLLVFEGIDSEKFGRTRSQATFYTYDLVFEKNSRFRVEEEEEKEKRDK